MESWRCEADDVGCVTAGTHADMEAGLVGHRVLIVEDEYMLADELSLKLSGEGMEVLGPARDVASALTIMRTKQPIDVAVLDINLRGSTVFDLADELVKKRIPFVFATGYARSSVPERFSDAPHVSKPLKPTQLRAALDLLLD